MTHKWPSCDRDSSNAEIYGKALESQAASPVGRRHRSLWTCSWAKHPSSTPERNDDNGGERRVRIWGWMAIEARGGTSTFDQKMRRRAMLNAHADIRRKLQSQPKIEEWSPPYGWVQKWPVWSTSVSSSLFDNSQLGSHQGSTRNIHYHIRQSCDAALGVHTS